MEARHNAGRGTCASTASGETGDETGACPRAGSDNMQVDCAGCRPQGCMYCAKGYYAPGDVASPKLTAHTDERFLLPTAGDIPFSFKNTSQSQYALYEKRAKTVQFYG